MALHSLTAPAPAGEWRPLVAAHRDLQIQHRAALAAENARALHATARRLTALEARLRAHGQHPLAAALAAETTAGAALLVALTSPGRPGEAPARRG